MNFRVQMCTHSNTDGNRVVETLLVLVILTIWWLWSRTISFGPYGPEPFIIWKTFPGQICSRTIFGMHTAPGTCFSIVGMVGLYFVPILPSYLSFSIIWIWIAWLQKEIKRSERIFKWAQNKGLNMFSAFKSIRFRQWANSNPCPSRSRG